MYRNSSPHQRYDLVDRGVLHGRNGQTGRWMTGLLQITPAIFQIRIHVIYSNMNLRSGTTIVDQEREPCPLETEHRGSTGEPSTEEAERCIHTYIRDASVGA